MYFEENKFSRPNPADTRLVMEFHFHDRPEYGVGSEFVVQRPRIFLTDHLFSLGVCRIVIGDMRDRSPVARGRYHKVLQMFEKNGGETRFTFDKKSTPFPSVTIVKEPKLTAEEIEWLQNEWYPKVYQQDSIYEAGLKKLWDERGYVSVVGIAHAIRLHKRYGMEVALIDQGSYIRAAIKSVEEQEYFLKLISKK